MTKEYCQAITWVVRSYRGRSGPSGFCYDFSWTPYVHPKTNHEGPEGGVEVQLCSFFSLAARWGGWSAPRPGRFTAGKETRYLLYRWLCEFQGRSGRVRKILSPPGIAPGPSSPQRIAIPTELSRPYTIIRTHTQFRLAPVLPKRNYW